MTTNNHCHDASQERPPVHREMSDEQLIARYQISNDVAAFAEILDRHSRPLHSHINRMLGDPTAADDVLQNTFLQLHRKASTFDPARRLRPWLYVVATNQTYDYLRRNRRHRALSLNSSQQGYDRAEERFTDEAAMSDEKVCPHRQLEAKESREWLHREADNLSDALREVVVRTHFQDLTMKETADELGLPLGTVKSRSHSARAQLTRAWQTRRHATDSP